MNNQALYWIALGVLALGLNSEYQKGNLPLAHRVADHAEAALCKVAMKAEQTWALARVLTGHQEFRADDESQARQQAEIDRVMAEHQADLDRVMALRQADLDRIQRRLDRLHAVMDQAQVEKLRKLELVRFKMSDATSRRIVVCPQTGRRIAIDADPGSVTLNTDNDEDQ
ncbi:MAG TPA: hypothetical protein VNW47_16820 [Terriglobales bacterium]|jgi:hypothetical protein|nr:hypothetical protein [Terriglobales bacterium]